MKSTDAAKNWELDIVLGAPGYVPAKRVTINPPMGRTCRERRRFYEELFKQAVIPFLLPILAAGYLGGGGPDLTLHKDKYGHFSVSVRYDQRGYGYLPLGHYGGGHGGGY
ncbi:hypothetical protein MRX96_007766 [Rhipicephalus microplus]